MNKPKYQPAMKLLYVWYLKKKKKMSVRPFAESRETSLKEQTRKTE